MRALVLRRFGEPLVLEERPAPVPRANQMLVRVRAARICGSDVHIAAGRVRVELPLVLGHEVTGTCDELGEVLVYAARSCSRCRYCRAGKEQLCPEAAEAGWARDGGFAETVLFPAGRHLFPAGRAGPSAGGTARRRERDRLSGGAPRYRLTRPQHDRGSDRRGRPGPVRHPVPAIANRRSHSPPALSRPAAWLCSSARPVDGSTMTFTRSRSRPRSPPRSGALTTTCATPSTSPTAERFAATSRRCHSNAATRRSTACAVDWSPADSCSSHSPRSTARRGAVALARWVQVPGSGRGPGSA
jgi:Alcohol dehydrogenase GroES-like domain